MTRIDLPVGRSSWELSVRPDALVVGRRQVEPVPIADVRAAVREVLERPIHFEPLRRALTPDDRITIVVDEALPQLAGLLEPILDHLNTAGISADRVTLLTAGPDNRQLWVEDLPESFDEVLTEVHDARIRQKLSYLATTSEGRRIYLNRALVDSDQAILLTGRGYDPLLGYSGAEGSIFPALADAESQQLQAGRLSMAAPDSEPWKARQEAQEVAWLTGTPFIVQAIESFGDGIAFVCGGLLETSEEGRRALEDRWHVRVDRPAATVVTSISGDPARHGFESLARALACASRIVEPGGCIVVLSEVEPHGGDGGDILRDCEEPEEALRRIVHRKSPDMAAAFQWASAACGARIYIGCDLPPEQIEEWFATPLHSPQEAQRLIDAAQSCLFLQDGHKTLATVES